ncbi:hypothetical protein PCANC_04459 [Puccinia coronata f. sp. avenae]|uniref:Uncharacterized protein n=1 Tax=Puccinia coronata f. sp. avenae TaxID=200324 RepID=A0A2N5VUP1_9BASI|nr:hypothetical protein PCANC_04459 [Puccinia coronata f. sp. avenae]
MTSVSSFIAVESHSPMKRLTHDRFCRLAGLYSGNREEALEQDIVLHFSVMSTYIHAAVVFFATNSPTLEFLKKTSIEERMPKRLVPARRGITPCQAGTRSYQPTEKLFVGEQVSVAATDVTSVYQTDVTSAAPTDTLCLCSNVSVGPADIKSVWATDVTSVASGRLCSARNNSSPSGYKLAPARRGALPWRAGASRYLLADEQRLGELVQACTSSSAATTSPPSKTACRRGLTGFFFINAHNLFKSGILDGVSTNMIEDLYPHISKLHRSTDVHEKLSMLEKDSIPVNEIIHSSKRAELRVIHLAIRVKGSRSSRVYGNAVDRGSGRVVWSIPFPTSEIHPGYG